LFDPYSVSNTLIPNNGPNIPQYLRASLLPCNSNRLAIKLSPTATGETNAGKTGALTMTKLLLIAAAGALGTLSRYAIGIWTRRLFEDQFPYGTLLVNLIGCFLLGFLMEFGLLIDGLPRHTHAAVTIGFLGAFTTFSTFGYETMHFVDQGQMGPAMLNIALNLILGLLFAFAGLMIGRQLIPAT
jgi:CrcB protein